jgi:hypothetical protein
MEEGHFTFEGSNFVLKGRQRYVQDLPSAERQCRPTNNKIINSFRHRNETDISHEALTSVKKTVEQSYVALTTGEARNQSDHGVPILIARENAEGEDECNTTNKPHCSMQVFRPEKRHQDLAPSILWGGDHLDRRQ